VKATTFRIAALLVLATIMQVFLMPRLSILHVSPDAIAVLVGFTAISSGRNTSMLTGFLGGMLTGLLSGQIGLLMLAGTGGGLMAGLFQIPEESHATRNVKNPEILSCLNPLQFHQPRHHGHRLQPARTLPRLQDTGYGNHCGHIRPPPGHCRSLSLHEEIFC